MKTEPTIPTASDTSARPKLCFDWRDWLPYVADMEASDAEKRETIETLWSIVLAFVDAGWEIRGHDEPGEKPVDKISIWPLRCDPPC